jgi:hypothetical protein
VANVLSLRRYRITVDPPDGGADGPDDAAVPVIDGVPLHELLGNRFPGVEAAALERGHWSGWPEFVRDAR